MSVGKVGGFEMNIKVFAIIMVSINLVFFILTVLVNTLYIIGVAGGLIIVMVGSMLIYMLDERELKKSRGVWRIPRNDLEKGKKYWVNLDAVGVRIEVLSDKEVSGKKYYTLLAEGVLGDEILSFRSDYEPNEAIEKQV